MRLVVVLAGVALVLVGILWILQGVGLAKGSFMTGRPSGDGWADWPWWSACPSWWPDYAVPAAAGRGDIASPTSIRASGCSGSRSRSRASDHTSRLNG